MVSGSSDLMDLLVRKMSYLNQAQTVHAENVANANTPGYKPLEVVPFSFGDTLKQVNMTMAVTDPGHIIPASLSGANKVAVKAKASSADAAADLEQESTKVSQTGVEYQLVTSIFHKLRGLFNIALKGSA